MLRALALVLLFNFAVPPAFAQTRTPAPSAAAIQRQADAQYARKNYAAALSLYLQSANMGNPAAENALGLMYENGVGTAQDFTQATQWFQKAVDAHYEPAERNLGSLYFDRVGANHDYVKALYLLQLATEQGDLEAQTYMAEMYYHGSGVTQNFLMAANLFQKPASHGNRDAEHFLGYMYWKGLGVTPDIAKAKMWSQKAAAQGVAEAASDLAQMNSPTPAPAPQPAQQSGQGSGQQGTCAAVYITSSRDDTYGTHEYFGAAWRFASYDGALAAAKSALQQVAGGIDPNRLPGGQYGPSPAQGSGCNYAHGAVAGKLKVAPGGSSMFNASGAAGTGPMGDGIYDIIAANFADSTDAAISAAMSRCQTENGPGENDREVCTVLSQW